MKTIGNIIWFFLGGLELALLWMIFGLLMCVTVIGLPLGLQCFKFAGLMLWPFGKDIEFKTTTGNFLLNIIWLVLCGWELAVTAVMFGLLWCITIIGIPFGLQCFKFAKLAFMPFGARVVKKA